MPLDFPSSPSVNDTLTSGTRTWRWDGTSWGLISSGITGPAGAAGDWATPQTIIADTGATHTILSTDAGKLITLSHTSAITLTLNTGLGLTAGQRIDLIQIGVGQVTVAGTATVFSTPTKKLRAQYSSATLIAATAANTFYLVGDLAAS